MLEQWLYVVLLALHNIALVILSGGLFFMMITWKKRLELGPDLNVQWDGALEDQTLYALRLFLKAMGVVTVTGFGFPVVHALFQEKVKDLTLLAGGAFAVKLLLVMILLGGLLWWVMKFVKPLKLAFEKAKKSDGGDAHAVLLFNDLKSKRFKLIRFCFYLTVAILIVTPILTYL